MYIKKLGLKYQHSLFFLVLFTQMNILKGHCHDFRQILFFYVLLIYNALGMYF